ncbi:hypothetical protein STEG23_023104 [Scotinomys teguina]
MAQSQEAEREKTPVRHEEKKPACHGGGHHVVEQVPRPMDQYWPQLRTMTLKHKQWEAMRIRTVGSLRECGESQEKEALRQAELRESNR